MDERGFEQLMRDRLDDPDYTLAAKLPTMANRNSVKLAGEDDEIADEYGLTKSDMWTDKYKPRGFEDLVGNNGVIT